MVKGFNSILVYIDTTLYAHLVCIFYNNNDEWLYLVWAEIVNSFWIRKGKEDLYVWGINNVDRIIKVWLVMTLTPINL